MRLPLTLAIGDYDHVRDLADDTVRPEGVALTLLRLPPEEIFARFTAGREWEASEYSLALYLNRLASGEDSVLAIPVFPSRVFRHGAFFTRPGGPTRLEQLDGARIGVPEWVQTAGVWARGILAERHGVALDAVEWVQAGVNEPGRHEKGTPSLPPGVSLRADAEHSLDQLLAAGEIDAIISARPPASALAGATRTVLEDPEAAEREYWAGTGVFPIMHVVALRRDVYERAPWIAGSLYAALDEARRRSVARLRDATASAVPLPWAALAAERAADLFGGDLWAYGIEANRVTIEAFLRYSDEQGVTPRRLAIDEVFQAGPLRVAV